MLNILFFIHSACGVSIDGLNKDKTTNKKNFEKPTPSDAITKFDWQISPQDLKTKCFEAINQYNIDFTAASSATSTHPIGGRAALLAVEESFTVLSNTLLPLILIKDISPNIEQRRASSDCQQKLAELTKTIQNKNFFQLLNSPELDYQIIDPEEQKLRKIVLQNLRINGLELDEESRELLNTYQSNLSLLENHFNQSLFEWKEKLPLREDELDGLDQQYIQSISRDFIDPTLFMIPLKLSYILPILKKAHSQEVRRKAFEVYYQRGGSNNQIILKQVLIFRKKIANLFQFEDYFSYKQQNINRRPPEKIEDFLCLIHEKVKPVFLDQYNSLKNFSTKDFDRPFVLAPEDTINPWDEYYLRNQKHKKRCTNENKIKHHEYFPLLPTLDKFLVFFETLFSVRFIEDPRKETWHPSVSFYRVYNQADHKLLGGFYLDLFSREGKNPNFWVYPIQKSYELADKTMHRPVSVLLASLNGNINAEDSLLEHDQVIDLIHEFGHIIHHLLGQSRFASLSGSSVNKDFSETISNALENFAYQKVVLKQITSHYKTGEPMPDDLIEHLRSAKKENKINQIMKQLFYSIFDMQLHRSDFDQDQSTPNQLYKKLYKEILLSSLPDNVTPESSFTYVMSGYAAHYYSYIRAQVYGRDLFNSFKVDHRDLSTFGNKFRKVLLEPGALNHGDKLMELFLGREPNEIAFIDSLR